MNRNGHACAAHARAAVMPGGCDAVANDPFGFPARHLAGLTLGLLVALFLTGCYGGGGPNRNLSGGGGPASLAGAPAVSYNLRRLDGTVDSVSRYRGRVVVMNFWATWCPPCKAEMPALEQLYKENRARGLVVLGIDQGESRAATEAFVRAHGITFPILLDQDQRYATSYVSVGLPTTVIVGRDDRVVKGVDGAQTLGQFRAEVAPLLAAR